MINSVTTVKNHHSNSTNLKGKVIMPKYVCSTDEKDAWKLLPGEASKQTFTNEEDIRRWYESEFPGQKIEMTPYTFDGDHWQNEVFADGKSIGQVDKYPDLKPKNTN